jgi:orotate phosphoribosyltransferase
VVLSTADLRGIGAVVTDVVCVIDRSEGGTEALAAEGLTLHSVVDRADLDAAGQG